MTPLFKLILATLACVYLPNSATALPKLFARDATCDSIACFPGADWGAASGWVDDFIQSIPPITIPNIFQGDQKKVPDQDPQIELFVNEPSRGSEACTGALPSDDRDSQGEAGDRNVDPCNTGLGQLVWPVDCADTQRNTEIGSLLWSMDPTYMTSDDPLCPQKDGGVGFWQALLTQPQIQTLRQQMGVKAVIRNTPYKFGKLTKRPPRKAWPRAVPSTANINKSLKKRETLSVIRRPTNDDGLIYLSSPPGLEMGSEYVSFAVGNHHVKVLIIDEGLSSTAEDLQGLSIDWIFALGTASKPSNKNSDPTGHGTCIASKITGHHNGVADSASLSLIKIKPLIGSFLDALSKVLVTVQSGEEPVRGFTVLHISGGYVPTQGDPDMSRMRDLIQALVGYQVIIVTSAGQSDDNNNNQNPILNTWPAMLSLEFDIITVGAVDPWRTSPNFGKPLPLTGSGPAITVRAPGDGYCAMDTGGAMTGDDVEQQQQQQPVGGADLAAAHVTGLISYFLTIYPLRTEMLKEALLPKTMRNYLQAMSKKRDPQGSTMSVWNGIYGHDEGYVYDRWFGLDPVMWRRVMPAPVPERQQGSLLQQDSSLPFPYMGDGSTSLVGSSITPSRGISSVTTAADILPTGGFSTMADGLSSSDYV